MHDEFTKFAQGSRLSLSEHLTHFTNVIVQNIGLTHWLTSANCFLLDRSTYWTGVSFAMLSVSCSTISYLKLLACCNLI